MYRHKRSSSQSLSARNDLQIVLQGAGEATLCNKISEHFKNCILLNYRRRTFSVCAQNQFKKTMSYPQYVSRYIYFL